MKDRIAILIDGDLISSPTVAEECGSHGGGGTMIAGDFTQEEAEELAAVINAGR